MSKLKTALWALILAGAALLTACGGAPSAAEIAPVAERLVTESLVLNDIFYGEGLRCYETVTGTDYRYVDEADLNARLALLSAAPAETDGDGALLDVIERLKEACATVFTPDLCAAINETMFVGITDDVATVLPRFVEDDAGYLMQHVEAESILPGARDFDFDGMTVVKANGSRVELELPSYTDGVADSRPTRVVLRKIDGDWRLDSMTY